MKSSDLASIAPGFSDPVFDSQQVFRSCLAALAAPGVPVSLAANLDLDPGLHTAAGAVLLALLDQDTRLWLSPGLATGRVPASLMFHTGCSLAASPGEADFALVASADELPPIEDFRAGSDEYPDRSATIVLQVPALLKGGWRLTGPGIRGEVHLAVPSLGDGFVSQWQQNHARFPRGVDLYLACGNRLCGLPRTTLIANRERSEACT